MRKGLPEVSSRLKGAYACCLLTQRVESPGLVDRQGRQREGCRDDGKEVFGEEHVGQVWYDDEGRDVCARKPRTCNHVAGETLRFAAVAGREDTLVSIMEQRCASAESL